MGHRIQREAWRILPSVLALLGLVGIFVTPYARYLVMQGGLVR